jgi:hypothetical protein
MQPCSSTLHWQSSRSFWPQEQTCARAPGSSARIRAKPKARRRAPCENSDQKTPNKKRPFFSGLCVSPQRTPSRTSARKHRGTCSRMRPTRAVRAQPPVQPSVCAAVRRGRSVTLAPCARALTPVPPLCSCPGSVVASLAADAVAAPRSSRAAPRALMASGRSS